MLRKTATILVCAAAFTFVAAQLPWDTPPGGESSSGETSSYGNESSSEESPFGSYDSYSSDGESSSSSSDELAGEETAAGKGAKPKRERAARGSVAGFNSQKSCPVCNSVKIKKSLFVEHNGQKIHVCGASCIGRVKRNPDAFIKILEKRGEKPES